MKLGKTNWKRLTIIIILLTVSIFAVIPIVTIVTVQAARHNFEYHMVPDRFLGASDVKGERQFISYRPFPYSLFRPKYFLPDTVVLYRTNSGQSIAKIYSVKTSIDNRPVYIAEDAETGELIDLYHKQNNS